LCGVGKLLGVLTYEAPTPTDVMAVMAFALLKVLSELGECEVIEFAFGGHSQEWPCFW